MNKVCGLQSTKIYLLPINLQTAQIILGRLNPQHEHIISICLMHHRGMDLPQGIQINWHILGNQL